MRKLIVFILSICAIGISCQKNNKEETYKNPNYIATETSKTAEIVYPVEEKMSRSICLTTTIIEDNVNLRNYPSINSEIILTLMKNDVVKVLGNTGENVVINNSEGVWLLIQIKNSRIGGWVFSKYVNINTIEKNPLTFVEMTPSEYENVPSIKLSYSLSGKKITVSPEYTLWKNYYVIVWDPYENDYHYTCKPGVYLLDKDTLELKHFTYLGSFDEWPYIYTFFTDDFEYLIRHTIGGTSKSAVRDMVAYRLRDNKEVFSGGYYSDQINNHTITIGYECDEWSFDNGYTDNEIMEYGRNYSKENPITEELRNKANGLTIGLIVICSYNLDTGERVIIDGKYAFYQ